jgi:hypothetical protein
MGARLLLPSSDDGQIERLRDTLDLFRLALKVLLCRATSRIRLESHAHQLRGCIELIV